MKEILCKLFDFINKITMVRVMQKYIYGFFALLIGFFLTLVFPVKFQSNYTNSDPIGQKTFNAVVEQSNIWGAENKLDFGFKGNWEERPEGIEKMSVSLKLISPLDESEDSFLIGYRAEIKLKPQIDKPAEGFGGSDGELYFVDGYGIEFHFYFLDEDGYCLWEVGTENKETLHSPGTYILSIKPGDKSELLQVVLKGEKIPSLLTKRIKKVCCWPVFKTTSGKPATK